MNAFVAVLVLLGLVGALIGLKIGINSLMNRKSDKKNCCGGE